MSKLKGIGIKAKFAALGELKRLMDCGSPLNWIFVFLATLPLLYFILKPSAWELGILMVIDTLLFQVNLVIDKKLFPKLYPKFRKIFLTSDVTLHEGMTEPERIAFLDACFSFPKKRAIYSYFGSAIKVIPSVLLVVFFWSHPTRSNFLQLILVCSICLVIWNYFSAVIFIDSHRYLSKLIQRLHEKEDWSQTFLKIKPERFSSTRDFQKYELSALVFLAVFTFVLQWAILYTSPSTGSSGTISQVMVVAFIGLILFSRIFLLSRNFFTHSLFKIFQKMENMEVKESHLSLPLHTSPVLATFEQSFNMLIQSLKDHEQELSYLVLQESDRSRYLVLGEISALIAHDMSGPLHVVQFVAQQLTESPELLQNPEYLQRLNAGIERTMDLLNSLKARLKNNRSDKGLMSFLEAHQHVLKILEIQFYSKSFSQMKFKVDEKLAALYPQIPAVDLIHVIENLYKNSVKNLLDFTIEQPEISLSMGISSNTQVEILIKDNGTGLSKERFEALTSFRFLEKPSRQKIYEGLGLRLTRRLVELHGGELTVVPAEPGTQGTLFKLTLKNVLFTEQLPSQKKYISNLEQTHAL